MLTSNTYPKKAALTFMGVLLFLFAKPQNNNDKISLQLNNISLKQAFKVIEKQYGYTFFYSSSYLNIQKKVNLNVSDVSIAFAIAQLINDPNLSVLVDKKRIIISQAFNRKYSASGYVTDAETGETLPGVYIYNQSQTISCQSNADGFFTLVLPEGENTLKTVYVGYEHWVQTVQIKNDINLNIKLKTAAQLNELLVESNKDELQYSPDKISLTSTQVKKVPSLLGEADVIKYMMLMPGIQKGSEGNNGLYVRGGSPDQNLILVDDAILYNAYHLFGFNSLFTGSELKSANVYKGGFSARYGGRLSSIIDLNIKDGNQQKVKGEAGIGFISTKAIIEGPLLKSKNTFMLSARRTYLDLVARPFQNPDEITGYYFYDTHGKINFHVNEKHKILISGYIGRDRFYNNTRTTGKNGTYNSNNGIEWGNKLSSVKHTWQVSPKLFFSNIASLSLYELSLNITDEGDGNNSNFSITSGITDVSFKTNLSYYASNKHQFNAGASLIYHRFNPTFANISADPNKLTQVKSNITLPATEIALYAENENSILKKLNLITGIRVSYFKADEAIYINPEPRISLQYKASKKTQVNLAYAFMSQYQHLLSTFGLGLPTDVWLPAGKKILPATSHLISSGLTYKTSKNYTLGIDAYYKLIYNQTLYKEGKGIINTLAPNQSAPLWDDLVTQGNGKSYGIEIFQKINFGKHGLTLAYTLSKTTQLFNEINNGKEFNANFDRRHDLSVYYSLTLGKHWLVNSTWVYGSGYWISLPNAEYNAWIHLPSIGNSWINGSGFYQTTNYPQRNNFQTNAYHKLDMSLQYITSVKKGVLTIELSVYNVYNRQNPFYHVIDQVSETDNRRVLKQISLFTIIPSLGVNFKF